jgi:hypothetical protein
MADSTFPPLLFSSPALRSGSAAPLDYRSSPLGGGQGQQHQAGGAEAAAGLGFGGGGRGLERISPSGVGANPGGGSSLFQPPQPGAHRTAFSRLGSSFRESTPRRRSATPAAVAAAAAEANAGAGGGAGAASGLFDSPAAGLVGSQQQQQQQGQGQYAFGGGAPSQAAAAAGGGASGSPWQAGGAAPPPPPPSASMMAPSPEASPLPRQGGAPFAAGAAAAHGDEENDTEDDDASCWVTAFGFSPADTALALEALASCGDVLAFGSGRGGGDDSGCSTSSAASSSVNWIHVRFATRYQAARALAKDSCLLAGGRLLLGVRPLQPAHRGAAARVAAAAAAAPAAGSLSSPYGRELPFGRGDGALRAAPASASRLSRPYRVVADGGGGSRAATERLPRPALGFLGGGGKGWSRIGELLFGL